MELFIALCLPIILIVALTLVFISDGIPSWAKNLSINSSVIWNTGIVGITTMSILIYLAKR